MSSIEAVPTRAASGKYRWVVVGLLFAARVINYVDRQMSRVLKPGYLQPELGWTERDYAHIHLLSPTYRPARLGSRSTS